METKNRLEKAYYLSWLLLAASIPLSKFTTSIFIFSIAGFWILLGNWSEKYENIKQNRTTLLLATSLFFIFFIGLWNTENYAFALKDLKVKLPLFVLPLFMISGPVITYNFVKKILSFLCVGAIVSAIIGLFLYINQLQYNPTLNYRELSPFISHIRLSLMLCIALGFFFVLFLKSSYKFRWFLIIPSVFILYYLNLIHSLSSFVLLFFLAIYFLVFYQTWKRFKLIGRISSWLIFILIIYTSIQFYGVYEGIFKEIDKPEKLEKFTLNGNEYTHDTLRLAKENGNFVGLYICYPEIHKEWGKRSEISIDSIVRRYPLRVNLIRYLTSRGLRKDSLGISKLSSKEIKAIERGIANVNYLEDEGIKTRIHQSLWEIKNWSDGASTAYNSVAMRLFFWDNAINIIQHNFWLGTGTGDIQDKIKEEYQTSRYSFLTKTWRSHNQYLTVLATLGFFSFAVFLIGVLFPLVKYNGKQKAINAIIGIVICGSMLWEDTLETQAGVCLTALLLYLPYIAFQREKQVKK